MRHKDGTVLRVTRVPPFAPPFVAVGATATIQPIKHSKHRAYAEDLDLYMVKIGRFTFWWAGKDLGEMQ